MTHPLPLWLDRLREGGRLLVPITVPMGPNLGKGVMLKVTRRTNGYAAHYVSFVAVYSAIGVRDSQLEPALSKALATAGLMKVKSVRRDPHAPNDNCVVHGTDTCLSLEAVASSTAAPLQ